jgi:hypothetical protein
MGDSPSSAVPSAPLSTTAIAAIATGIGVSLICIVALIVLLVRAIRNHKQLLADLEARGISIIQAQGEARDSVARPRAVLRRNSALPYNKNSGWGTLTSVETFKSGDTGVIEHYVPPKPAEYAKKSGRLSWPFYAKRMSGHNIHLAKIKGSRLSTVLEDPKQSAIVPVMGNSNLDQSRSSLFQSNDGRPTSVVSLLQYHPALRNISQDQDTASQNESPASTSYFRTEANERLQRAKSVAAVPSAEPERPQLRARSTSLSSHASGKAPDVILPPLPLDIARIKTEADKRSQLRRIPSKQSDTTIGSADTFILANRSSPDVPSATKKRPQKITKPRTRGSTIGGSRPFRDSLDLRARVLGLRHNINSPNRTNVASLEVEDPYPEDKGTHIEDSSTESPKVNGGLYSGATDQESARTIDTSAVPALSTPKRKLKAQAYSEGSPERHKRNNAASRVLNGVVRSPRRQHSQASSRSSGGNPFQWDPTPLSSNGKPSALKGSPSARQGHRRKNSVRISLVPTFHGPPTRTPSPSFVIETRDDTTSGATATKPASGLGIALSNTRLLPTPPSSSTFAPELKFPTTSLHASLTLTSPTLPLVGYDQGDVVSPTDQVPSELYKFEIKRASNGSAISLSKFPGTASIIEPLDPDDHNPLRDFSYQPYDFGRDFRMPDTPYLHQYPWRQETPEPEREDSQNSLIDLDVYNIYNSEHSNIVFQTPTNVPSRAWQSAFAAIPEESSISSQKTYDVGRSHADDDSPPVSPKTMSPPRFNIDDRSAYNLPVYATTIPEETSDTIDPAILSKDAFMLLNSSFDEFNGSSIISASSSKHSSLAIIIPTTPDVAQSMFEPLLQVAFPSSPPTMDIFESPILGHRQSNASSLYSLPSPPPSLSPTTSPVELPRPIIQSSPRPLHAQLPRQNLALNFSNVPKLTPSPQGPRSSPPRPLRTSIAALRRMNSDANNARKEKTCRGERRYLRLGREDSVPVPGDESWLDELDTDSNVSFTDEQGRMLVGNVLDEWDEGCTSLDLDEGVSIQSTSTVTPDTENFAPDVNEDTTAGAQERSSSIWDDGEEFWASPTPPRPGSPNKPRDADQQLASSAKSKKRDFEVARDVGAENPAERKKRRENGKKKTVLGVSRANVQIQVTSPGGRVVGTPGLYDAQGFLRY